LVITIELARYGFWLAQRQLLLGPARRSPEEDKADRIARRIPRHHARWCARAAGHPILRRRDRHRDDPADILLVERGNRLAVDPSGRQMEQQIDRPRQPEAGQGLGQLRTDAFQRFDLGEQRIENIGPHH